MIQNIPLLGPAAATYDSWSDQLLTKYKLVFYLESYQVPLSVSDWSVIILAKEISGLPWELSVTVSFRFISYDAC